MHAIAAVVDAASAVAAVVVRLRLRIAERSVSAKEMLARLVAAGGHLCVARHGLVHLLRLAVVAEPAEASLARCRCRRTRRRVVAS